MLFFIWCAVKELDCVLEIDIGLQLCKQMTHMQMSDSLPPIVAQMVGECTSMKDEAIAANACVGNGLFAV